MEGDLSFVVEQNQKLTGTPRVKYQGLEAKRYDLSWKDTKTGKVYTIDELKAEVITESRAFEAVFTERAAYWVRFSIGSADAAHAALEGDVAFSVKNGEVCKAQPRIKLDSNFAKTHQLKGWKDVNTGAFYATLANDVISRDYEFEAVFGEKDTLIVSFAVAEKDAALVGMEGDLTFMVKKGDTFSGSPRVKFFGNAASRYELKGWHDVDGEEGNLFTTLTNEVISQDRSFVAVIGEKENCVVRFSVAAADEKKVGMEGDIAFTIKNGEVFNGTPRVKFFFNYGKMYELKGWHDVDGEEGNLFVTLANEVISQDRNFVAVIGEKENCVVRFSVAEADEKKVGMEGDIAFTIKNGEVFNGKPRVKFFFNYGETYELKGWHDVDGEKGNLFVTLENEVISQDRDFVAVIGKKAVEPVDPTPTPTPVDPVKPTPTPVPGGDEVVKPTPTPSPAAPAGGNDQKANPNTGI